MRVLSAAMEEGTTAVDELWEGTLGCTHCGRVFPVEHGIPRLLVLESGPTAALKQLEMLERDQIRRPVATPRERHDEEVEAAWVLDRVQPSHHDSILDAGCGVGRITRRLLKHSAQVVATDFSFERLRELAAAHKGDPNLECVQADLNHLPFRPMAFTKIVSTQVLEHLPSASLRGAFLASLARLLVPGGTLVLTVYNQDRYRQLRGLPDEGEHESGIFYHCYRPAELRRELQHPQLGLSLREVRGVLCNPPCTYRLLPRLGPLGQWLDRACSRHQQLGLQYGRLLLACASRPE
ncbi:MAG: methyltransferase domain-containing protein [Terriglobales bacterium]